MKIEMWPLDRPKPYARNPRKNAGAVAKVAASLREFGWQQPLVVDGEGVLIVGHTRLLAARELKLEKVPVIVARDLTPAQVKAYRLADNRTGEEAEWDEVLLKLELQDIKALDGLDGIDIALTGFDDDELERLLSDEPEAKPGMSLSERFGVAPFSVLNAREGWWQDRKRAWIALGIRSELGRGSRARGDGAGRPVAK